SEDATEDFEWIRREIQQGGGECWVFGCNPVSGWSDGAIQDEFRKLRSADYQELAAEIRALLTTPATGPWNKLKPQFAEVRRIDFFDTPESEAVEALMKQMEEKTVTEGVTGAYSNRIWVTRRGVKVDRIGSSWLIRRFIDPQARFVFVDPQNYSHKEGE